MNDGIWTTYLEKLIFIMAITCKYNVALKSIHIGPSDSEKVASVKNICSSVRTIHIASPPSRSNHLFRQILLTEGELNCSLTCSTFLPSNDENPLQLAQRRDPWARAHLNIFFRLLCEWFRRSRLFFDGRNLTEAHSVIFAFRQKNELTEGPMWMLFYFPVQFDYWRQWGDS